VARHLNPSSAAVVAVGAKALAQGLAQVAEVVP
jgi:hypothetical protein